MNKYVQGTGAFLVLFAKCGMADASIDGIPSLLKSTQWQQASAIPAGATMIHILRVADMLLLNVNAQK